jgi:sialate O-acetylesterase
MNSAGSIYNSMIAPMAITVSRGAIWYQEKAMPARRFNTAKSFPLVIENWRGSWGTIPVLLCTTFKLRRFQDGNEGNWAELDEASDKRSQLPKTGMAVTTDIRTNHAPK